MEEKVKKKVRVKKSAYLLIVCLVLALAGIVFGGRVLLKRFIKDKIENNYNSIVVVTKDTDIYDKKESKIGTIKKGVKLKLKEVKKSKLTKNYEVENGDFYISYQDVEKTDNKDSFQNKYLVFNKNIEKDKVTFLKDGKEVLTLSKEISLPIEYLDDSYYYVNYLGNLLQIKREKDDKIVDKENTKDSEYSNVSVIKYQLGDCDTCVNEEKLKEQLNYIKDNNISVLSQKEYSDWTKSNIRLKSNYVVLTTDDLSDNIKKINKEYSFDIEKTDENLKYVSVNSASSRETHNRYSVNNNTNIDRFKQMLEGKDIYDKVATKIAVLNYHFFYDPTLGESCDETICLETQKFRQHLDYLRDNGFKTLTIKEFTEWIYGERDLPEKSVLITVDDGAKGTGKHNGNKLIPLLEEYKMHATLFLIAGWWDISNYASPNLDVQSHTFDMHQYGTCGRGQLVCASYEQAKADLERSLQIIGDKTSFCYPFYSTSDTAIQAVKDVGFRVAFGGGSVKATRSSNKYVIPRYPIHSSITMDAFISMVN